MFSRMSRHLFLEDVNPPDGLLVLNSPFGFILQVVRSGLY